MAPSLKSPCAELVCFQSNNISKEGQFVKQLISFYISSKTWKAIHLLRICWCFFYYSNFNIFNSNWVTALKEHSIGSKFGTLFRALITSQAQNNVKFSGLKCLKRKNQIIFMSTKKGTEGISYRDKIWIKRRSSPRTSNSFYITGHKQLTLILNGPHQLKFPFVSV